MIKAILFASLLLLLAVITFSQSLQPCQSGQILCYSDMTPYAGHGPAKNLPPNLCPNDECKTAQNQDRRVVVLRIDTSSTSWGAITPQLIWNAVQNAINQWNTATDSSGKTIGYYFVLDQQHLLDVPDADITITRDSTAPYLSANTLNEPGSSVRTNVININPRYTDPASPSSSVSAEELGGSIAHEIGHLIGLVNNRPEFGTQCKTIMRGINDTVRGTGLVTNVQAADVEAVNRNFASRTNCSKRTSDDLGGSFEEPTPTPTPEPNPTPDCPDNDHDNICDADDCNDNAFWASFDWDSDGFCEDVDCNDNNPYIYPGAPIDTEPMPGEDRNCNGIDDYRERFCGLDAEVSCRAAGRDWDASHCKCNFFSDPSPIVIDVLGNGFALTSSAEGVRFDLNNDDVREQLSWTTALSDDAWLTLDRNGNGLVDNGSELFGNFTPQPTPPAGEERNGFLALAEYDKASNGGNGDGVISRSDTVFTTLRLWQDLNHNGISEATELFSLPVVGIKTIETDYKLSKKTDEHGNQFRYRAKVKDSQGQQLGCWAWDVFLTTL
jgi:hypothetical protein